MYEIARFQRLWSVRTAGFALPGGRGASATVDAAPGHAVERSDRSTSSPLDVRKEALLVGAVVVGKRDDVGGHMGETHVASA